MSQLDNIDKKLDLILKQMKEIKEINKKLDDIQDTDNGIYENLRPMARDIDDIKFITTNACALY